MKLGIIGAGKIVAEFLSIEHLIKELKVVAICGQPRHESILKTYQNSHLIDQIFLDYDDLLASDVDVIYVALPNNLHFEYAKKGLLAGKNMIVEKPFTSNSQEAEELVAIAKQKKLFLFEAITNQYRPNYLKIKELLPSLGDIKIVQCNYSQYSSRYDKFKAGEILPAFDPKYSGGALMDLNLYNLYYVVGLFGKPIAIDYQANIECGIDTSGVVTMDYGHFKAVCVAAKDCSAPSTMSIQGNKGYIYQPDPAYTCDNFSITLNGTESQECNVNQYEHRMVDEFNAFTEMFVQGQLDRCHQRLENTMIVSELLTQARQKAGIIFPSDSL
jgi:scyllo-inositol 2-dehydrogenase (NADP+)